MVKLVKVYNFKSPWLPTIVGYLNKVLPAATAPPLLTYDKKKKKNDKLSQGFDFPSL